MVSIIIPALREVNKSALDAIRSQSFKDYEIVIIKGVSPNGKARNEGVALAKGDLYVFLDDDAEFGHDKVLERIVKPILEGKADIVGASRRLPEDSSWFAKLAAKQLPLVETPIVDELLPANPAPVRESWIKSFLRNPLSIFKGTFDQSIWAPITTTCVAMKASVYKEMDGFNEELWWGVDSEFFYRASQKHFLMFLAPQAWVYHPYVSGIKGLWRKYFKSGIGTAQEMKLNPERNIQPALTSRRVTLWFIVYRFLGSFVFLFIKPIRGLASLFSSIGYLYGWFTPKELISPKEVSQVNWEKVPYWLIVLSVLVSPLTYHGTIELGFTLKISEILLFFALLMFLWNRFYGNTNKSIDQLPWYSELAKDPLVLILLGYCLVALFSLTRAINIERGVLVLTQTILFMISLVVLPREIINSKRDFFILIKTYVFSAVASSVLGIFQFFLNFLGFSAGLQNNYVKARAGYPRVHATFLEPLYMAHYLLTPIAIASVHTLFSSTSKYVYALFVMLVGLNLGFSRGGWIGFLVSMVVLAIFWLFFVVFRKVSLSIRQVGIYIAIVLISFVTVPASVAVGKGIYTHVGQYVEQLERVRLENKVREDTSNVENIKELDRLTRETEITKERVEGSPLNFLYDRFGRFFTLAVGNRLDAWRAAFEFIGQSPIMGVGVGNFGYQERQVDTGYSGLNFVNNQPLEILAETGLMGFVFYLLLNGYWVYLLIRTIRMTWLSEDRTMFIASLGLLAGYAGVMMQFFTVSNWNVFHYWFVLGMGVVAAKLSKIR